MADKTIADLPAATSLAGEVLFAISQAGSTKRAYLLQAAATGQDADGNPTPPGGWPATDYPEGTLLLATSFPTTLNSGADTVLGGDMLFQVRSAAWTWISGSYRASNALGVYSRSADGRQECLNGNLPVPFLSGNTLSTTWTYPAPFSALNWIGVTVRSATGVTMSDLNNARAEAPGVLSCPIRIGNRDGTLAAGDSANVWLQAIGRWQ